MKYSVLTYLEALVHTRRVTGAIAFKRLPRGGVERSVVAVLEHDVDDAGDGVRAVLRGGAVSQHFDALDGADGDGIQVRAGSAATDGGIDVDQGAAVAALAVHQHQHLVRPHAPQGGRPHRVSAVADRRAGKVEGGNQRLNDPAKLGFASFQNLLLRDHVDRHGRVHDGPSLGTGTYPNHHQFLQLDRFFGYFLGCLRTVLIRHGAGGEQAGQQYERKAGNPTLEILSHYFLPPALQIRQTSNGAQMATQNEVMLSWQAFNLVGWVTSSGRQEAQE